MLITSKIMSGADLSDQLTPIVRTLYLNGNLRVDTTWTKGKRWRCVLRCNDSRAMPARAAFSGRRTCGANWQAHKDFMFEVFKLDIDARIKTALATYNGWQDFVAKHAETYHHQVGAPMLGYRSFGEL